MALKINTSFYDSFEEQLSKNNVYSSPKAQSFGPLPPIDIVENKDSIELLARVPNLDPYSIKLEFDKKSNTLHVMGKYTEEEFGKVSDFERSIKFGDSRVIDEESLVAYYSDDMLKITVRHREN